MKRQSLKEFQIFKKNNNCSLTYLIEEKANLKKIENLIDNVLEKKSSFIFESVEKAKTRGRYTIFGFNPDITLNIYNNKIFINKKIQKKQNNKKFLEKFNDNSLIKHDKRGYFLN